MLLAWKVLLWASSNCLSVRKMSNRLFFSNSVLLTYKVQFLKFGWWYSNQTWTVSSSKGCLHFPDIISPWGWGKVKMQDLEILPDFEFVAAGSTCISHTHLVLFMAAIGDIVIISLWTMYCDHNVSKHYTCCPYRVTVARPAPPDAPVKVPDYSGMCQVNFLVLYSDLFHNNSNKWFRLFKNLCNQYLSVVSTSDTSNCWHLLWLWVLNIIICVQVTHIGPFIVLKFKQNLIV